MPSPDTGAALSACFSIPMICASLYRLFFIQNLPSQYDKKILRVHTPNFRGDYHPNKAKMDKFTKLTLLCLISDTSLPLEQKRQSGNIPTMRGKPQRTRA